MGISNLKDKIHSKAKNCHSKTPILSKLPFPAIAIIAGVALINGLVWVADVDTTDSIVIITSIVVAATAAAISEKFGTFSRVGGIIGTAVSAAVLILLAVANLYILWKLVRQLRAYLSGPPVEGENSVTQGYGCMFGLLRRLFRLIDRWASLPFVTDSLERLMRA
ncbi:MAG: hypothetical protein Q9221_000248 [Calogaya cf. arnoldii]